MMNLGMGGGMNLPPEVLASIQAQMQAQIDRARGVSDPRNAALGAGPVIPPAPKIPKDMLARSLGQTKAFDRRSLLGPGLNLMLSGWRQQPDMRSLFGAAMNELERRRATYGASMTDLERLQAQR